jgi:calcium-dependent protein kinase
MDKDNSGLLNIDELTQAFEDVGLSYHDAKNVIDNADFMGNSKINYTEFLAATLHTQNVMTEERM